MKKQAKRTVLWSILAVAAVLIIILSVYIADLTAFPGNVQEKGYDKQDTAEPAPLSALQERWLLKFNR